MFNIFKKPNKIVTWSSYKQHEEMVDGNLIVTINEHTNVEDLNYSIVDFMVANGMSSKYKVMLSKVEE